MAPSTSSASLFHPKLKKEPSDRSSATPGPPKSAPQGKPRPSPRPKDEPDDDGLAQLPAGPFQEFRLLSSALNGWKYDVMKFDARRPVDLSAWRAPIRLNRKEARRDEPARAGGPPEAVGPMLGPDGKPVVGADGRIVMVDADGRPIHAAADGAGGGGGSGAARGKVPAGGRKKFQKKTRQVFLVPEATRQLRREERHPWVMEDASGGEVWVGKLEDISRADTHAFFMPAADDVFKFVPAHRWYKFQKKPNYHIPDLEEAESIMANMQKNKDPERWLLHRRNGQAPSAATSAIFKADAEGRDVVAAGSLVYSAAQSRGPGGRRLRTVDSGAGALFGDDDEDGEGEGGGEGRRRRERERGEDGDLDEQLYEEDFADDDEKIEENDDDDEAKELEERLKREYKSANKTREGYIDESDDDEDGGALTRDGEKMKKLIKNLEKNAAYDSDDEKNPYASSEEEEEEEEPPAVATAESAIQEQQQQQQQQQSRSGSQTPAPSKSPPQGAPAKPPSPDSPPAASPASPRLDGHSVVAKRATSPKAAKPKQPNGLGVPGSPPLGGSRETSPANGAAAASVSVLKTSIKRKAPPDDTPHAGGAVSPSAAGGTAGGGAAPKPKKRKSLAPHGAGGAAATAAGGALEDRTVIEWLRTTPHATTRDCIQHFTPYLTDEAKKSKFTALVKEVAQLKGGVLVLRNAYRTAPSAAAAAAGVEAK